jgi:hypothetical protein
MPWEALCSPCKGEHGPVTTDPIKGEASFAVTPLSYDRGVANLGVRQDAGSLRKDLFGLRRDEGIVCPPRKRGSR